MNAVLVGFKRSPFTIANKGLLSKIRPEDILSQVITDLIKSTNINKSEQTVELITVKDAIFHYRYIIWVEIFNKHKKKDDLADSFLQGRWYLKNTILKEKEE